MDLIFFELFSMVGYFTIMGIFMVIAILTARKRICWVFYAIGSILQFLSLVGQTKSIRRESYFFSSDYVAYLKTTNKVYWVVFIILMIVFAVLVMRREERLRAKARQEYEATHPRNTEFNLPNSWQCDCGRKNAEYTLTCPCGIKKIEIKSRNTNQQNTPTQNQ